MAQPQPSNAGARPRLVMKFGGTSMADLDRIRVAADKAAAEAARGYDLAIVVSAMAGETNRLVGHVRSISTMYDAREYDAVVSAGEQVTAGLLALMLQERGVSARSWQGWQIAVRTDAAHGAARIESVDTEPMTRKFDEGLHAVVAGFQGLAPDGRIATLGRGGSDTTAVALAAALGAERCDIYTDVDAVYTTDPRIEPSAQRIDRISFEEMLELASLGAKVLQTRSVELAMRRQVPLQVLSSFAPEIGSMYPGTLVTNEEAAPDGAEESPMESNVVTGVAYSREEAKLTVTQVPDTPGVAAKVFGPLSKASVNIDMIVQNIGADGRTDMTCTVALSDVERAEAALMAAKDEIGFTALLVDKDVAKVSIVGVGMRSHTGVAQTMFECLAREGVNIQVITTSEIKVSVLIARRYLELAVRALHASFGLSEPAAKG